MKDAQSSRTRIDSLQALRALAFLGIFFFHANFFIGWPELGVSIFYVMSGFLMTYRYENTELTTTPKKCLAFSLNKIKKLYPLHIITMICAVILSVIAIVNEGLQIKAIIRLVGEIVLNVTLLQTWVPHRNINASLNGVAWYLSVTVFLYFVFPWIKKIIERSSTKKLLIISGFVLIAEILLCIPFIKILGNNSPIYIWFMYCFPVFRLGDFFIGCVLKRVFFEWNLNSIGMTKATICEVLTAAITVLVIIWFKQQHSNIFLLALHNWTTVFIPLAAIWVMLFAAKRGLLTKILSNKIIIFVGNISAFAFLIHFVITQYTSFLISCLDINVQGWNRAILVFVELVVTIVLSVLYKYFQDNYISKHFSLQSKI